MTLPVLEQQGAPKKTPAQIVGLCISAVIRGPIGALGAVAEFS
jgi:hypothetical protein